MKYQITLLLSTIISLIQSELLFVLEHFRHGATGPSNHLDSNGKDLMNNTWNESEIDELTPIGTRMQYILGLHFAKRYERLFSSIYNPKEIYVSSTNDAKTIQSAIAHTSAFYFNHSEELNETYINKTYPPAYNITEDLNMNNIIEELGSDPLPGKFQTIPVHIFHPFDHDFLLQELNGDCLPVEETRESNLDTPELKEIIDNFNKNYSDIWNFSQQSQKKLSFEQISLICDDFFVNDVNNKDLSSLNEILKNNSIELSDFSSSCKDFLSAGLFNYTFNLNQRYFTLVTQSPPMKKMLKYMDKRRDEFIQSCAGQIHTNDIDYTKPKIVIWSGLNSTVAGTQMFFNQLNTQLNELKKSNTTTFDKEYEYIMEYPTYASNIFIEFHWNEADAAKCSMAQMNDPNNTEQYNHCFYVQYLINGKSYASYNYEHFKQAFERIVVDNDVVDNYCNFKFVKKNDDTFLIVCIVFVAIILIGCLCSSVYFYNGIRKTENKRSIIGPLNVT